MVFEYIKGKVLSEVDSLRVWKAENKEELLKKCCDGLNEIRSAGIWHRVPKPCKIILEKPSQNIRWFDFSRAEILEDVENGTAKDLAEYEVDHLRESLKSIMYKCPM